MNQAQAAQIKADYFAVKRKNDEKRKEQSQSKLETDFIKEKTMQLTRNLVLTFAKIVSSTLSSNDTFQETAQTQEGVASPDNDSQSTGNRRLSKRLKKFVYPVDKEEESLLPPLPSASAAEQFLDKIILFTQKK